MYVCFGIVKGRSEVCLQFAKRICQTDLFIGSEYLYPDFRFIIPGLLQAVKEGVGYVKTQLSCVLFIMLIYGLTYLLHGVESFLRS